MQNEIDGEEYVDTRLIAQEIGIQHENLIDTISNRKERLEKETGLFRFETGKPTNGRPEKYYLLNEEQTHAVLLFCRNTEAVVDFKFWIVKAFKKAKQSITKYTRFSALQPF